jgi:hypothetical protein
MMDDTRCTRHDPPRVRAYRSFVENQKFAIILQTFCAGTNAFTHNGHDCELIKGQ